MKGKNEFMTVTAENGNTVVFHGRSVSFLESSRGSNGSEVVKVVFDSGQYVVISGSLSKVMSDIYGHSITFLVAKFFQKASAFLARTYQREARGK